MSVSFNKTGVVRAVPISGDLDFVLVDTAYAENALVGSAIIGVATVGTVNEIELADENGDILTDGLGLDTDGLHGFIEGFNIMSIYSSSTITCNELIEW